MKKEIENIQDIKLLVDEFYKKVVKDEIISHFFTQVIKFDWETHIPKMYTFWDMVLFGTMGYKGNPMEKHIEIHKKEKLYEEHFSRWLKLWEQTVDEFFIGDKAEEAKKRATSIGGLMMHKINLQNN